MLHKISPPPAEACHRQVHLLIHRVWPLASADCTSLVLWWLPAAAHLPHLHTHLQSPADLVLVCDIRTGLLESGILCPNANYTRWVGGWVGGWQGEVKGGNGASMPAQEANDCQDRGACPKHRMVVGSSPYHMVHKVSQEAHACLRVTSSITHCSAYHPGT
jgi:hypothetical protein